MLSDENLLDLASETWDNERIAMHTCPTCGGSGGIQMRDEKGNVIYEQVCTQCSGTGQVPD